jgi:hypothetical protein
MTTFWISRLRVIGDRVEPAEVVFGPHLNVIAGASDTGKSYIRDCLNYMLGAEKPPKVVPENKGYSTILLEFETADKKRHILKRSLKMGGDFLLFDQNLDDWTGEGGRLLKRKHRGGKMDTLSFYMLKLCGLAGTEIMTSKSKKRPLSFRDIASFTLISETSIIEDWSPVYPNRQFSKMPADKSIFDFLVSGDDASSMITSADPKVRKATWRAKYELYGQLIDELKSEAPYDVAVTEKRLRVLDKTIDDITSSVTESSNAIAKEQEQRNNNWRKWHSAKSRQLIVNQLLVRFELLAKHYRSDIARLNFLAEADHYLSQFGEATYCPVCGSLMKDHKEGEHRDEPISLGIKNAAKIEAAKLEALLVDLQSTSTSLRDEQGVLQESIKSSFLEMERIESRLKCELEPRLTVGKVELASALAERGDLSKALRAQDRIKELTDLQVDLGPEPKQTKTTNSDTDVSGDPGPRREFLNRVAKLLNNWNYKPVGIVEFGEKLDLVVDGQSRASHGKGVRAIMHAAFTLALMIQAKGRHPGVILLDSPLTSYKSKDNYQNDDDVQRGFFQALIKYKSNQVIVLENKEPDEDLKSMMHYEHFSGNKTIGRYGFYPT